MTTIRPRRDSDLDQLVALLEVVHLNSGYPVIGLDTAIEFIVGEETIQAWVAEVDSKIVGHASIAHPSPESILIQTWQHQDRTQDRSREIAEYGRLFVDPNCLGRGIAKQLTDAALDYAEKHSLRLLLYVLGERFPIAWRMYDKWGWVHYGDDVFKWGNGQVANAYCYASPVKGDAKQV